METELLAYISRGMAAPEAEFGRLALDLFAYQYERNPLLRAYWQEQEAAPGRVTDWREIPPLPVAAFRHADVACFDPTAAAATFLTSGTTRAPAGRGRHHFRTLALYDGALLAGFRHFLLPDGARLQACVLAPNPAAAPESSLSYYFGRIVTELGAPGSRFYWGEDGLRATELMAALAAAAAAGTPLLLMGTAFAFVHLLDACRAAGRRFPLPAGSRALETGGFKGRAREVPQPELYAAMAATLGIPVPLIVNQYGMTELSSQFYDPGLRAVPEALSSPVFGATAARFPRAKQGMPWSRVLIRHPETMAIQPEGETGLIQAVDLANLDSAFAILTQDLGRAAPGGFHMLGRAPGAVPRGCSIAADAALERVGSGSGRHRGGGA